MKNKAIANRIKKTVGGALSAPYRAVKNAQANMRHKEADILRETRKYDKAPNFQGGKPTNALKMRTASKAIKRKYK